jgi:hypothetical protein
MGAHASGEHRHMGRNEDEDSNPKETLEDIHLFNNTEGKRCEDRCRRHQTPRRASQPG